MLNAPLSGSEWQAGRNRFNHDWLKNKFLLSLDRLVKIAELRIDDEEYASRFIAGGLLDWERERETAAELIESFEESMSLRTVLDREPLAGSLYREWLRSVVHILWQSRIGITALLEPARQRLSAADWAYTALSQCIGRQREQKGCTRVECCRSELIEFREKCRELATAFEAFPHRSMVS